MQVFIVMKNADFTEGRGPMFLDKVFAKKKDAHDYIMDQFGISGSPQGPSGYSEDSYNGYDIRTVEVIQCYDSAAVAQKRDAVKAKKAEIERLEKELTALGGS